MKHLHTHTHRVTHTVYILKYSTTMSAGIPGPKYQGCNNTSERYMKNITIFPL